VVVQRDGDCPDRFRGLQADRNAWSWPWIRLPILLRVSDRISVAEVAKVARLARLALTEEELARATVQLGDIVDHFADIDELDLDDVEPMTQPFPLTNVLRDDDVTDSLDRDEVLAAAPEVEDGRFKVPPIIGLEA
jgi:aspartyl-tRNA(Asn)/glutamyl-tRNA(Gln) amidotransferase subunit C